MFYAHLEFSIIPTNSISQDRTSLYEFMIDSTTKFVQNECMKISLDDKRITFICNGFHLNRYN